MIAIKSDMFGQVHVPSMRLAVDNPSRAIAQEYKSCYIAACCHHTCDFWHNIATEGSNCFSLYWIRASGGCSELGYQRCVRIDRINTLKMDAFYFSFDL